MTYRMRVDPTSRPFSTADKGRTFYAGKTIEAAKRTAIDGLLYIGETAEILDETGAVVDTVTYKEA